MAYHFARFFLSLFARPKSNQKSAPSGLLGVLPITLRAAKLAQIVPNNLSRPIGFVHSSQIKQVAGDSPSMAKRRSNGHPWRMAAPPFALLNSASVHRCARGPKSAAP